MNPVEYLRLLADNPRVEAFRRAIELSVSPGQVVLDLGTGIGTYAMFAARAGARVYAVEANPILEVARQLATDNGLADRITFMEGWAGDLQPPERADVLIFEDYAPYLCQTETALILEDIRRRWLKPEARVVPQAISVMLAPVTCPETYDALVPLREDVPYGLDIDRLTHRVLNNLHPACWAETALLAAPLEVAHVNPLEDAPLSVSAEVSWELARGGELHGLGLWLDLDLADGVAYSNAPAERSSGWGQVFLPLARPLMLRPGEQMVARLATVGGAPSRTDTWWTWRVRAAESVQDMNTFRGIPLSLERLQRARLDYRPVLSPQGRARRAVLDLTDGQRSVAEIAVALRERFPEAVRTLSEAYRVVAKEIEAAEIAPPQADVAAALSEFGGEV
ncbi:MAG: methyltransferase domain-containing protein [Gemmatimonadota bacterium]|nr:MAG: methyltransferase domain-containing protein [Gemmatimonadota bacterium]